jgi:hypothetical protein
MVHGSTTQLKVNIRDKLFLAKMFIFGSVNFHLTVAVEMTNFLAFLYR